MVRQYVTPALSLVEKRYVYVLLVALEEDSAA